MPGDEARRYAAPNAISNAIGYANFYSRSHNAVIRVYDAAGALFASEPAFGLLLNVDITRPRMTYCPSPRQFAAIGCG